MSPPNTVSRTVSPGTLFILLFFFLAPLLLADGSAAQVPDCPDGDGDGVADEAAEASDRDGDGVDDAFDNCPDTPNPDQGDLDFDGDGDYCDNCVATSNPAQVDFDGDGRGDLCDPCPGHPNTGDQTDSDGDGLLDLCDPTVYDLIATLGDPGGHGSAELAWKTNAETDVIGFHVITIKPGWRRIQLSETMIPCQTCTVYGGGSYVFTLEKHHGGQRLYVERHFSNGAIDLFGPAGREISVPGLMIDDPPASVVPAAGAAPVGRRAVRRE